MSGRGRGSAAGRVGANAICGIVDDDGTAGDAANVDDDDDGDDDGVDAASSRTVASCETDDGKITTCEKQRTDSQSVQWWHL